MGNCRYGDQCINVHEQGEVTVKMSPTDHQQWQLQQMNNINRNHQAEMTQRHGSAPAMHPMGVYRPPEPMAPLSKMVTYNQGGREHQSHNNGVRDNGYNNGNYSNDAMLPSRTVTYNHYGGRGRGYEGRGAGGRGRYN
jgi:hypothetical protein